MRYAVVIEKTGNGYSAYAPDVLGCVAAADTLDETEDLIREAIALHIEAMLEHGEVFPEPLMSVEEARAFHNQAPGEYHDLVTEPETTVKLVDVDVEPSPAETLS